MVIVSIRINCRQRVLNPANPVAAYPMAQFCENNAALTDNL